MPQQDLVDEEVCPDYSSANSYPAKPGDVLTKKFQLLVKIGWGSQSTVWLARDISSDDTDDARHEKEIESHITQQDSEQRGRVILRTCLDHFERCFVEYKIPLPIAKAYIYFLLIGLDYLHSDCKVIHTNLKLGNILMSFEIEHIFTDFIKRSQLMQCKVDNKSGQTIYRCHNDFGALDWREIKNMIPKIADFGLATRLDRPATRNGSAGEQLGIYPIEPDHYRAPEEILGCGWDFKADIWNFGVLPVLNDTGEFCDNAQEFFAGPFFGADDEFRCNGLIPSRNLEDTTPFLEDIDRTGFLSFIRDMLTWLPEERKTAREMTNHPFLKLSA
ncbi:serine/threonine-protein kinase [Penicillium manginii]|uniref:serine/threonine-protein kinase n=1 Tax=Penicillium manginii TaxID=203109 RepID=UPI0025479B4B|nr:serine/threonine-protein kinase [Penicillium manginii]KAJ5754251.1 serine/threonine-protein kinase [Penicillium manginii]